MRIDIRVTPRASKNAIEGVKDGRLIVRVTAPPVDSAANDAVVDLFAKLLRIPKRQINIVLGSTGRNKTIEVSGLAEAAVKARLQLS